jgi:hypothetical protein
MPINFIPNDPDSNGVPMREVNPRPNRPASRAGYDFVGAVPQDVYDPATQPDEFLFWQCREGALAALEAWEAITGESFSSWQPGKKIELRPDEGEEPNAFYDRVSLSFFHFTTGGKTFYSGASTDVVAHEAGHGILDAIRPELILSSAFEVNSFHEAFADCVAILTALHDGPTRAAVLADVRQENFVEGTAENLAACIKVSIENADLPKKLVNATAPRRARNDFQWQLPSTLPDVGSTNDGPGKLINEIHSFGQLFSGCFYDSIVNIFERLGGETEAQLLDAAKTAGLILSKAVAVAPLQARFFREVGRTMLKVDETDNDAANRNEIKAAFEGHNIPLGTGAMLAPVAALAGAAPTVKATAAALAAAAKKDLLARIGAVGKVATQALRVGGEAVAQVIHERQIPCGGIDKRLKGVLALAHESVLVGNSGGRAAVLDALPDPSSTAEEVETFVRSLVKRGAIDFGGKRSGAVAGGGYAPVTHRIKTVRGKKILVRFRYACPCH